MESWLSAAIMPSPSASPTRLRTWRRVSTRAAGHPGPALLGLFGSNAGAIAPSARSLPAGTDRGAFHDVEAAARFCTLRVTRIVATVPTRDGLAKSRFRRAQLHREPLRGRPVSHVSHANLPSPLDYRSGEGEFSGTGRRTLARRHDPAALRAQPRHGVDVRHL